VASAEEALRLLAGLCDVAVLYGAPQALRYAALLRHHCPRARLLLCLDALASRGLAQRASAEQRPDLQALAARVHTQEAVAAWSVDAVLARSHNDAARLRGMVAGLDVHVIGGGEDAAVDAALHAVLRLPQERARAAAGE
jgi:hypothetical protein